MLCPLVESSVKGGENMTLNELQNKLTDVNEAYSLAAQTYIATCQCDQDTRNALDEISRQTFYAIVETQNAILEYLKNE